MSSSSRKSKKSKATRRDMAKLPAERSPHPLNLFRPHRLAALLAVNPSTIWRWRQLGILPEPVTIDGVRGWCEAQIKEILKSREEVTR